MVELLRSIMVVFHPGRPKNRDRGSHRQSYSAERPAVFFPEKVGIFRKTGYRTPECKRNIEMTPLCKIEVTPPRVLGSREVRRGGVVDEQAGVQPS